MLYVDSNHNSSPGRILGYCKDNEFYAFKLSQVNLESHKTRDRVVSLREHSHNVYHIVLLRQGEGKFLLDGQLHSYLPNSLVLTSPGQPHDFRQYGGEDELVLATFTFSLLNRHGIALKLPYNELLSQQFGQLLPDLPMPVELSKWQAENLFGLLNSYYQALRTRGENGEAHVAIAATRILLTVAEFLLQFGIKVKSKEQDLRLLKVRDFIENNLSQRLGLAELARKCCMEPSYFCRSFKRQFECSPIEFVLRCRIEAAKSLLRSTSSSCQDIAELTGFKDPVYFSRIFKKRCRQTPREYRMWNSGSPAVESDK